MRKASFRIGSVMGIPIYLHYSFLLILPFLALSFGNNLRVMAHYAGVPVDRLGFFPYLWGFVIAVALFASVLLHELGHSYVALKKKVQIRGITLMLFGGVAQLEEMPSKPGEEAQIALAGPFVSFLIGIGCYLLLPSLGRLEHPNLAFTVSHLGFINIFLGLFNLLPAFPMDGGRILRSLLAKRRSFVAATNTAANVGKAFAFLFGVIGLLNGNFFLVLIAFFIYLGASQEYQFTVIKTNLDGLQVRDLMAKDVKTVDPETSVQNLLERMIRERHTGYPVVQGQRLVGCVTLEDIETVPAEKRNTFRVADIMSKDVIGVSPDDDIYLALKRMSEKEIGRLPVLEVERLVGIISRSDIMLGFKIKQLQS